MGSESNYPVLLKYTFILHFIVAMIFGVWLFILPDSFNTFIGHTTPADPVNIAYGALLIGIGMSSILAFRSNEWQSVKILVELELIYTPLAIIGGFFTILNDTYPIAFMWVYVGIMALFFILYLISYYQKMKS